MKSFVLLILFILYPYSVQAQDYDRFVLKYQSVQLLENALNLELVLEQPKKHKLAETLKKGAILKLVAQSELYEKKFFRDSLITKNSLVYYLRYDPLTRQFTAMQEARTIVRNADADFLLNVLIQHIQIKIPVVQGQLEKDSTYVLQTKIDLEQSDSQNWLGANMFATHDKTVQPLEFDYEFTL